MPVKADQNSEHLQLVISNGEKFHQALTVIIKNSNVLIQPTNSSQIHITLHSEIGTQKRKNCHFRIESNEVRNFSIKAPNKTKKGMLVEWNRIVSPSYDCPLELRFPSRLASSDKAEIVKNYNTTLINYKSGTLILNFWFTSQKKEELNRYFNNTGVSLLMFQKILKTGENFVLTYNINESDQSYKNIEKTDDYFEIDVSHKNTHEKDNQNKVQFIFGLTPETKKTIIFQ